MRTASGEKIKARVLLVEDDPWDAGLVQEALDELEERPHQNLLGRAVDLFHATTLPEALAAVETEAYDLILLDLGTGGPAGLLPYLRLRDFAPDTPFVILATSADELLALTAMREGASGYLLKEDLDCLPLARAMRMACERQHALTMRASMPANDDLTGLLSRTGFLYQGELASSLGLRWGKSSTLSVVRLTGYGRMQDAFGAQARDLALLETAEMMRDLFPSADLVARTGPEEFAALTVGQAAAGASLAHRAAAWVVARTGRSAGVPALQYQAEEKVIDAAHQSLAEWLHHGFPQESFAGPFPPPPPDAASGLSASTAG